MGERERAVAVAEQSVTPIEMKVHPDEI